jgi:hypothetical protein
MFSLLWLEQAIASNKLYDLSNKGRDLSYADMFRIRRWSHTSDMHWTGRKKIFDEMFSYSR